MNYVACLEYIYPNAKHNVDFIVITRNGHAAITLYNPDMVIPTEEAFVEAQTQVDILIGASMTNKPKTEIELLKQENLLLKAQVKANSDISDFHEELIVEMAMVLYQ